MRTPGWLCRSSRSQEGGETITLVQGDSMEQNPRLNYLLIAMEHSGGTKNEMEKDWEG